MSVSWTNETINITVIDTLLQFSSARQNEIFELFQNSGNFFFYLALSFALIGGVILLIRPSLWRWQPIISYIFILFIMIFTSINGVTLFFDEVAFGSSNKQEKVFSPQAVILNVTKQVKQKLNLIFNTKIHNINELSQIKSLNINTLERQLEFGYYNKICKPIAGKDVKKYIGASVNSLAKTENGRTFINKMSHSYFNLKHAYKLNDYYYTKANFNPLITSSIKPAYAVALSSSQNITEITGAIKKRMDKYVDITAINNLGWDKSDIWQNEAQGIKTSIKQVEIILEDKKSLPLPEFLLNKPAQGLINTEIYFRNKASEYITKYGFKKQMDYPVVLFLNDNNSMLNCLDFHEKIVSNLNTDFKQTSFYKSKKFSTLLAEFKSMLPITVLNPEKILIEELILPTIGKKIYNISTDTENVEEGEHNNLNQVFTYVQSLLLGIFLLITPFILLIGLLLPFWGYGIIFMLVLGVGWLGLWDVFLTISTGIYNHIAPFMISNISIENFVYVYVYGTAFVHGIVSVFTILLLPLIMKSLPFKLSVTPVIFGKEKPSLATKQLDAILQTLTDKIPASIKEKVLPERFTNSNTLKQSTITNEKLTEKTVTAMQNASRVETHVNAMENKSTGKKINTPKAPEHAGVSNGNATTSGGGNAYGMFQKVMQENYMTLGHDAVNALQMTQKHMQHLTVDDMRTGEEDGKTYVEVKQTAIKSDIGGEKTADDYVRFYSNLT